MFNTKRIIFLIGLLSLVTLTGALLAGPAFAGKPESSHKTLMCHWNSEDGFDAGADLVLGTDDDVLVEPMGWYLDDIDDKSYDKHMLHGDIEIGTATAGDDGELGTDDDGVFTEDSCGGGDYTDNRDDDDGRE